MSVGTVKALKDALARLPADLDGMKVLIATRVVSFAPFMVEACPLKEVIVNMEHTSDEALKQLPDGLFLMLPDPQGTVHLELHT